MISFIKYSNVGDMPSHIYKILLKNNLGDSGYMKNYLQALYAFENKRDYISDIFIIIHEENGIKKVAGWAICQDLFYKYEDFKDLSIYIFPENRKNGYGSKLIQYILDNTNYKISCWIRSLDSSYYLFKKFMLKGLYLFDMVEYELNGKYKRIYE